MDHLDTSCYNKNITALEFLKVVGNLNLKDYVLINEREYNFIFQRIKNKKAISDYIRLTLMRTGEKENILFYWDLELSFKPFAYKHNHRENAHIQSEYFKFNDTEKCFNYFLNMIDRIKVAYGR